MTEILPIGTLVEILPDTFERPATGTIAGHLVYAHPTTGAVNQLGYAIHLDKGFFAPLPDADTPQGQRCWVGTIVCHVDSVARLMPDFSEGE